MAEDGQQGSRADSFGPDKEGRLSMQVTLRMPPSDNKLYWPTKYGGLKLTPEGHQYKRYVSAHVAQLVARNFRLAKDFKQNVPYEFFLAVYFDQIELKSWKGESAKQRYKKVDLGNRQKLIIDAMTEAVGVDDRHIFKEVLVKRCDPENPRMVALLREQETRDGEPSPAVQSD
jgi:Holliday junction resolvase RusA-like endonuclease